MLEAKKVKKKDKLISFPEDLLDQLEQISNETRIPVTQLTLMASYSLVANYKEKGTFIFADLLNPEHRK